MYLYFSTNDKYYSRFMRFLFKEPTSHIGIGFEVGECPIVVDCTKPFGKVYHLKHWESKYEIKISAKITMTAEDELEALRKTVDNAVLKPYDWGAYYYGFFIGILWKWFYVPPPKTNKYGSDDADLCTEVLNPIKRILKKYEIDLVNHDLAAMTPHMVATEIYRQTFSNERVAWYGFKP